MAVDYLTALGAGSGIDTKAIVDSLVEAEKAPAKDSIDRGKERAELQVSAFGLVKSSLLALKGAFDQLKDLSDLKAFSVTNPSTSLSLTATSAADSGTHRIQVTQLADRDSWSSGGFAASDTSLNSGSDITLTLSPRGSSSTVTQTTVTVSDPTPTAIVTAINSADLGVSAQLVNTGEGDFPYVIALTGEVGLENAFSMTSDSVDVSFTTSLSTAADATLDVNGISVTRSSNTISDVITGVTMNLSAVMADEAIITVQQDTSTAKAAIENLVTIYNDVNTIMKSLNFGEDADDELVGSLSGDTIFRSIFNTVKGMVTGISSTPSGDINYFADFGVSFQRDGSLSINETTLDAALTSSFDDIVQALSAGTENQTEYGELSRGLAGDASKEITDLLSSTGSITRVVTNAEEAITDYEQDLDDLEDRMQRVYDRYLSQFTAMQSIVDQMNNTRSYLEQQMKALPYNNRD